MTKLVNASWLLSNRSKTPLQPVRNFHARAMEIDANYSVYFSRLPIFTKEKKEDRILPLGFLEPKT